LIIKENLAKDDTTLQNGIIKEIIRLAGKKISLSIKSSGGKLTKLEIDDKNLSQSKKTQLQEYINGLE